MKKEFTEQDMKDAYLAGCKFQWDMAFEGFRQILIGGADNLTSYGQNKFFQIDNLIEDKRKDK